MNIKWSNVKLDSEVAKQVKKKPGTCKPCVVTCFHPKCKKQ